MYSFSKTKFKRNFLIFSAVFAVAAAILSFFLVAVTVKPSILDKDQIEGVPGTVSDRKSYISCGSDSVCIVGIDCIPDFDGKKASVFLTNPADSGVLVRAEIYTVKEEKDEETGSVSALPDKLIGQTGFVRPGCYVENVTVRGIKTGSGTNVLIKIATMIEDSGKSNGIFYVRGVLN